MKNIVKEIIFTALLFVFCLSSADAKVYIDITSSNWREIPISISAKGNDAAKTVEEVVKNDLYLTGIFEDVDPTLLGAEIKIEIQVEGDEKLQATAAALDLIANRLILKKKYEVSKGSVRALAHSIANDLFKVITDKRGSFRTKFTYIVNNSGKKELHIMDWDGHNSNLIESKGLPLVHNWSDDGNYIYYSAERNRKWRILKLDRKKAVKEQVYVSEGLNLVGDIYKGRIVFSSSKDGSPEIYLMNTDGSGRKKITKSYGIDISPVFSPDGSKIAFVSDRGGSPQIYVMDDDGRNLKRLTFGSSYNQSPSWSLDGKWIAYVSRTDRKNQIFLIKSNGSGARQLTDNGNNENPTFSPNGLFIAFDSDREETRGIYLMRPNGEGQKRITPEGVNALIPKWSPFLY